LSGSFNDTILCWMSETLGHYEAIPLQLFIPHAFALNVDKTEVSEGIAMTSVFSIVPSSSFFCVFFCVFAIYSLSCAECVGCEVPSEEDP
jgi:hypothetical protein